MNKKTIEDHLGNRFESVAAMCEFWNVNIGTYKYRMKQGWLLEKVLTTKTYVCKDHLGNEYPSLKAMCKAYGITKAVYEYRIKQGWSVEKALTTKVQHKYYKDHLGNRFKSLEDMCEFHKMDYKLYKKRIDRGWTVERALTQKRNAPRTIFPKTDHTGKEFNSTEEMCDAWGIPAECFKRSFVEKWPLKKCLTQKVRLEKKIKHDKLCLKCSARLTEEECRKILEKCRKHIHIKGLKCKGPDSEICLEQKIHKAQNEVCDNNGNYSSAKTCNNGLYIKDHTVVLEGHAFLCLGEQVDGAHCKK